MFHGTATTYLNDIKRDGLTKRSRNHVHLSDNRETAEKVGQRHGTVVILVVDAAQMHAAGHRFYQSDNGVWLTDAVAINFLIFPDPRP